MAKNGINKIFFSLLLIARAALRESAAKIRIKLEM